jgi:hypothetical protein
MRELVYLPAEAGALRVAADGRLLVPVVALRGDMVLHAVNSDAPEFIPQSVLSSNVGEWVGKPVVFGHPVDRNGRQLSASAPGVIDAHAFGTIEHARVSGNKLLMDCHIDPARATKVGAGRLLERMRAGQTSEVSIGAYVETDNTPGTHAGKPYARRWMNMKPDHLAALEKRGACSCDEGGCGFFQRAAETHIHEDDMPMNTFEERYKVQRTRENEELREQSRQIEERDAAIPLVPRTVEKRDEAPDPYASARVTAPCPKSDPHYQSHGVPPDSYALAIERAKREGR